LFVINTLNIQQSFTILIKPTCDFEKPNIEKNHVTNDFQWLVLQNHLSVKLFKLQYYKNVCVKIVYKFSSRKLFELII